MYFITEKYCGGVPYRRIIRQREMMKYRMPYLIAEAGCNHMGDMSIAKEMIQLASIFCKVDAIKFQKRCNKVLLSKEQYDAPHPCPENAFGNTYGEHREFLEFSIDEHKQLQEWCMQYGIEYSSSVWDIISAKEISRLNPKFIKIPSACNNNYPMLDWLCQHYDGQIHISLGMTNNAELEKMLDLLHRNQRMKDTVLYSCTSGYPVPFNDVALLEISKLKESYEKKICGIGFSGHHNGIAIDIAAYTLGAAVIERHFTLDHTWKGTDHRASLEPDGMRKLKRNLVATQKSLTYKQEEILEIEQVQREKLKYRGKEKI